MRHTETSAAIALASALAMALSGCFDTHVRDGDGDGDRDGDGGVLRDDAGDVVRDCYAAHFAPVGAPCSFSGACEPDVGRCEPADTVPACIAGRIERVRRVCSLPGARNCHEYMALGGGPGIVCPPDFAGCTIDEGDCCFRRISCEAGSVIDSTFCGDCVDAQCPGYAPPPPERPLCTSTRACDDGATCLPPGAHRGCGACRPAEDECEADGDCLPGSLCTERAVDCRCDGSPFERVCAHDCRTAESDPCGDEARCGADGRCRAISCGAGWACGLNLRCTPGADAVTDAHGCSRLECASAADCDCGACIDGRCHDGPGTCELPVP